MAALRKQRDDLVRDNASVWRAKREELQVRPDRRMLFVCRASKLTLLASMPTEEHC
jgi:hypothetical protein